MAIASFHQVTSRCSGSGGSSSSTRPQARSKTFFDRKPAMSPPATLNGMKRSLPMLGLLRLALGGLLVLALWRRPRLHGDRLLLGHACLQLAATLQLGVHLGTE